jgi:hypothetical protein
MNRRKIKLFREMIDPELIKDLELDKISKDSSDKEYFFSEKTLNKDYEFGPFNIHVEKVFFQQGFVIMPIEISCDGFLHRMFLAYDSDENIHYGSQMGQEGIIKIEQMLGPKRFQMLDEATEEIINDIIPEDFWDVRGYSN